jgi:hypothetical protein
LSRAATQWSRRDLSWAPRTERERVEGRDWGIQGEEAERRARSGSRSRAQRKLREPKDGSARRSLKPSREERHGELGRQGARDPDEHERWGVDLTSMASNRLATARMTGIVLTVAVRREGERRAGSSGAAVRAKKTELRETLSTTGMGAERVEGAGRTPWARRSRARRGRG